MPDFDINIRVKDGQAIAQINGVNTALQRTERQANRVRGAFRGLFTGFGIAVAVREFINLSNATVAIENRLKLVEDQVGDTEQAFQRLRDIARRTRSPLEENVALFQRAAQAQSELGATTEEIFQFVEATGTALAIQGGAANTARGALIQLSQAIGATVVRAEEFNSILEGALPLAQAAARGIDEAGGSVARLRQLVISGEISSREFFNAVVSQQDFLQEQFRRTASTIAQAFTVFRNEAIATFRVLNDGTGVTTIIANTILTVADNLDTIARLLTAGGLTFLVLGLARAFRTLAAGIFSVTVALLTNPLTAIPTILTTLTAGLVGAGAAFVAFSDLITVNIGGEAVPAVDLLAEAWERLTGSLSGTGTIFETIGNSIQNFISSFDLRELVAGFLTIPQQIAAFSRAADAAFLQFFVNLGRNIEIFFIRNVSIPIRRLIEDFLNDIIFEINKRIVQLPQTVRNAFDITTIDSVDLTSNFEEEAQRLEQSAVTAGERFRQVFDEAMAAAQAAALGDVDEFFNAVIARANARAFELDEDLLFSQALVPAGSGNSPPGTSGGGGGTSFADVVKEYENGILVLGKLGQEQRIYAEVLRTADRIGRDLTQTEQEQIEALVRKTEILETASDIYDDLNGRVDEYILRQQALNDLLDRGAIGQTEADFALSQSDLVQDLRGVDESLGGQFNFDAQRQAVTDWVNERTIILQQAREQDLLNEEEYQSRLRQLTQASQLEILNLELDRWDLAVASAQDSVGILLATAEEYAGKQSGIYKSIFVAQKAFAIAEATINTFRAISNALAAPFPPPIPQTLAAAAAVAGGAQVAAIVASTISGLRDGGEVRGPGGPRADAAGLFALSNGEFVVNAAAAQANLPLLQAINNGTNVMKGMRDGGLVAPPGLSNAGSNELTAASRTSQPLPNVRNSVQVPVNVINVDSEERALASIENGRADEVIINRIGENAPRVRNTLGFEN